jgi:hypothetical protein
LIERTSIRIASLFTTISLLRYLLIIGYPEGQNPTNCFKGLLDAPNNNIM